MIESETIASTDQPAVLEGELRIGNVDLHERFIRAVGNVTAMRAVEQNFLRLASILDQNAISYFCVRSLEKYRAVVGVRLSDRPSVLRALQGTEGADAPYIRQMVPAVRVPVPAQLASDTGTLHRYGAADVLRTTWFYTDASGSITFGEEYGCEIEFWSSELLAPDEPKDGEETEMRLVSPRPNAVTRKILDSEVTVLHPFSRFTRLRPASSNVSEVPTVGTMTVDLVDDVRFPIDIVYTWVDSNDLRWQSARAAHLGTDHHEEATSVSRYINRDELRFSLRSIHQYVPWVRNIYIVTASQTPSWLDTTVPGVTVVDHREIFADTSNLPTFNSHAIESQLHRIPGLSEHFLYLNDDMFFGRPVLPQTFFGGNGVAKFFTSPSRVPFWPSGHRDTPVDQATKNGRQLLHKEFGVQQAQVMEHAPYALRKSVLEAMEDKHPEAFGVTAANRFRSAEDYNIPSNLAHYYGYLTNNAIPGGISFSYIGLSVTDLGDRLSRLLARRDRDAFCLNDTFTREEELVQQLNVLNPFLESYFPTPSPWEKEIVGQ
ncbi:stealth family protein [Arthrobacter sp. NPDC055138]